MLRLILVSCLVAIALGQEIYRPDLNWDSRIVGGSNAGEGQIPYQVSLRTTGNFHFCGGSILTNRWVLSAAHCTITSTTGNTVVVVGTLFSQSGGIVHLVSAIVNHPDYDANFIQNDVSVVQTATTITFTANVQPIALGSEYIEGGVLATASGWGQTSHPGSAPNHLQVIQTSTLTFDECRSRHTAGNAAFVFPSTLCTFTHAGQGICMGDSGGPLSSGGQVIGVASWVIPCANGWPDAWARVSSFRSWIETAILPPISPMF